MVGGELAPLGLKVGGELDQALSLFSSLLLKQLDVLLDWGEVGGESSQDETGSTVLLAGGISTVGAVGWCHLGSKENTEDANVQGV